MKTMVYAGTYTAKSSQGIYSFSFEDGRLSSSQLFCEIKNPKYLTKKDNCLITVADFDYESGVALINAEGDIKSKGYISKMVNSRNRINEKIIFLHVSNTEEICDLMHSFLD